MRDTLRWAAREPRVWLSVGACALVNALAIEDGGAHWLRFGAPAAVLAALSVWWAYQAAFPPEVRAERERARFDEQVTEIIRNHEAKRAAAGRGAADGSYAASPGAGADPVAWVDVAQLADRLDRIAELLHRQQQQLADLAAAVARPPGDDAGEAADAMVAEVPAGTEPAGAWSGDLDAVRTEVAALRDRLDDVARGLRADSAASLRALRDHIDATLLTLAEALMWTRGNGHPPDAGPAGGSPAAEDVPPAEQPDAPPGDAPVPEPSAPAAPAATPRTAAAAKEPPPAPGGPEADRPVRHRKRTRRRR